MDVCANGVPRTCVPGTPTSEVCNGLDDDCDGLVDEDLGQADICNGLDDDCDGLIDEDGIETNCIINPGTINVSVEGHMFSVTCKLYDVCDPANRLPISGSTVSRVYVSRADRADNPDDDVTFPDPSTVPCPDLFTGLIGERGISENLTARDVSTANVTFTFNQPWDGYCFTPDGNRDNLGSKLFLFWDTYATVCISGKTEGKDFQACMPVLVRNK
jgi:hypothetical protein